MGLNHSPAAGRFDGAYDDHGYGDDDEVYRDEALRRSLPAGGRAARPLTVVRPPRLEFALVAPQDFDAMRGVADRLRADDPVIVDLRSCGRDLTERVLDFCSGLAYALGASLEYIGDEVVLLAPGSIELSSEAPGVLRGKHFFNQV